MLGMAHEKIRTQRVKELYGFQSGFVIVSLRLCYRIGC